MIYSYLCSLYSYYISFFLFCRTVPDSNSAISDRFSQHLLSHTRPETVVLEYSHQRHLPFDTGRSHKPGIAGPIHWPAGRESRSTSPRETCLADEQTHRKQWFRKPNLRSAGNTHRSREYLFLKRGVFRMAFQIIVFVLF